VVLLKKTDKNSWIRITVTEGRNNLIKRMLTTVGHPVLKIKRIAFGPFSLGKLKPGDYLTISPTKIKKLLEDYKIGL